MAQHSSKGARFQAVTANRLLDGEVVYLAADNSWTEVFGEAEIADGPEAGEACLRALCQMVLKSRYLSPICLRRLKMKTRVFAP